MYHPNSRTKMFRFLEESFYFDLTNGMLGAEAEIIGKGRKVVFSSYSYLSLNGHPKIVEAARRAMETYGTGAGGVRAVSGSNQLHAQLEAKIASWFNHDTAVVYPTGFAANEGSIFALLDSSDAIFADYYAHQSLRTGFTLSGAPVTRFKHNDLDHLTVLLEQCTAHRNGRPRNIVIVVEGVYSMHGTIPDLPRLLEIAENFECMIFVDEAHSLGVLGDTGKGITEHFGIDGSKIPFLGGTFSKAIPSTGGYVCASRDLCRQMLYTSPQMVYSAASTPVDCAAALAALEVIEQEPDRVHRLHANIRHACSGLTRLGYNVGGAGHAAVIPIMFNGAREEARILYDFVLQRGIWLVPFFYPVVPEGQILMRCGIMADHTPEHIDTLLNVLDDAKKSLPFLSGDRPVAVA